MSIREVATTVTVGVPVVNEITNNGVITALNLEELVVFGLTYGAWFKIGMGVALLLLIVERGISIRNKLKGKS